MKHILFIVGSLREGSFNHQLAAQAQKALEHQAVVSYLKLERRSCFESRYRS